LRPSTRTSYVSGGSLATVFWERCSFLFVFFRKRIHAHPSMKINEGDQGRFLPAVSRVLFERYQELSSPAVSRVSFKRYQELFSPEVSLASSKRYQELFSPEVSLASSKRYQELTSPAIQRNIYTSELNAFEFFMKQFIPAREFRHGNNLIAIQRAHVLVALHR